MVTSIKMNINKSKSIIDSTLQIWYWIFVLFYSQCGNYVTQQNSNFENKTIIIK